MNIHFFFGFVCYTGIPHMLTSCPPPTSIFLSHHSMRKKEGRGKREKKGEREEKKGKGRESMRINKDSE